VRSSSKRARALAGSIGHGFARAWGASASCRLVRPLVRNSVGSRARLQALVFRGQARNPREQWTAGCFIPLVERAWSNMRLATGGSALGTRSWHHNHDAPLPHSLVRRISIGANAPWPRLRRSIAEQSRPQPQPQLVGITRFVRRRVYWLWRRATHLAPRRIDIWDSAHCKGVRPHQCTVRAKVRPRMSGSASGHSSVSSKSDCITSSYRSWLAR
jgi:hypothetical protein